jgi:hypothetical protein
VPGTAALSDGEFAEISSVSCASAGNCSAGGSYEGFSGDQAFVVSAVNGKWGKAEEVPGTAALNTNQVARMGSVSCARRATAAPAVTTQSRGLNPSIPPMAVRR